MIIARKREKRVYRPISLPWGFIKCCFTRRRLSISTMGDSTNIARTVRFSLERCSLRPLLPIYLNDRRLPGLGVPPGCQRLTTYHTFRISLLLPIHLNDGRKPEERTRSEYDDYRLCKLPTCSAYPSQRWETASSGSRPLARSIWWFNEPRLDWDEHFALRSSSHFLAAFDCKSSRWSYTGRLRITLHTGRLRLMIEKENRRCQWAPTHLEHYSPFKCFLFWHSPFLNLILFLSSK